MNGVLFALVLALVVTGLAWTMRPTPVAAQNTAAATITPAQETQIRSLGYQAGYTQGRADAQQGAPYDFQSHAEYAAANQGFNSNSGISLEAYRLNYRTGFEDGYDDGYYGRPENSASQPQRTFAATPAANPSNNSSAAANGAANPSGGTAAPPAANAAAAQPAGRATGENGASQFTVPAGTALELRLNNTLSTRSSQPGDSFSATVTAPVLSPNGQVLIPTGSLVLGQVGQATPASGLTGTSSLQLRFQQLRLPDGHTAALSASVSGVSSSSQGVGNTVGNVVQGTPSANQEGGVQQSRTRSTVGDVAAGGAVGALLGALVGGGKGAAIGTAAGAGLGVLLASRAGPLDLPVGTPIKITLNEPVYLR